MNQIKQPHQPPFHLDSNTGADVTVSGKHADLVPCTSLELMILLEYTLSDEEIYQEQKRGFAHSLLLKHV